MNQSTDTNIQKESEPKPAVSNSTQSKQGAGPNVPQNLLSPSDTALDAVDANHKLANEMKERGNKHVKLAEYTNAIEAYTQAIAIYAEDAVYYCNRALCYLKLERYLLLFVKE